MTNHTDLIARLRAQAESASRVQRMLAEDKSLRQHDCDPPRADLYSWPEPAQTLEGKAAAAIESLAREVAGLREALEPFARAESISTGFNGKQNYAVLHYPVDAEQTIALSALLIARAALAEGGEK